MKDTIGRHRRVKNMIRDEVETHRRKTLLEDLKYEDFFEEDQPTPPTTIFGRAYDVIRGLFRRQ